MDILGKLRVIFWGLVVGLWGLFMYQYISDDLAPIPKIQITKNPFYGRPMADRVIKTTPEYAPDIRSATAVQPAQPGSHLISPLAGGLDIKEIGAHPEDEHRDNCIHGQMIY